MSNVGIVLISHSAKVVEGIKDIIIEMVANVSVELAGGTEDNAIGTSIDKIQLAIEKVQREKGVLLFYDIGSAKMNADLAVEMLGHDNVRVVNAPLLEGAFVAAVESGMGKTIDEVQSAVEDVFENN